MVPDAGMMTGIIIDQRVAAKPAAQFHPGRTRAIGGTERKNGASAEVQNPAEHGIRVIRGGRVLPGCRGEREEESDRQTKERGDSKIK